MKETPQEVSIRAKISSGPLMEKIKNVQQQAMKLEKAVYELSDLIDLDMIEIADVADVHPQ